MSTRRIQRTEWIAFFDHTSALLIGKRADVEISSMEIGAQVVAHLVPLLGMVYDPKDDVLEIALDGLDHIVRSPREIYVDDPPFGAMHLAVTDGEGVRRIITLSDPLLLPAAASR
jgi:hypothetical protein